MHISPHCIQQIALYQHTTIFCGSLLNQQPPLQNICADKVLNIFHSLMEATIKWKWLILLTNKNIFLTFTWSVCIFSSKTLSFLMSSSVYILSIYLYILIYLHILIYNLIYTPYAYIYVCLFSLIFPSVD